MKLHTLLQNLVVENVSSKQFVHANPEISSITIDSRKVKPGCLFIARQGWYVDGNNYVAAAINSGAAAIIISRKNAVIENATIPIYFTPKEDPFLGLLAAKFFQKPTEKLRVFGITGTNGKTSVTYLLEHMLKAIGERVAIIGTVNYRFEEHEESAPNTTPDGIVIQRFARKVLDQGATCLIMEVSSHGLQLDRVAGVEFSHVGFTNLTQDHLDFHKTFDAYQKAKERLFTEYLSENSRSATVFIDDLAGEKMLKNVPNHMRSIRVSLSDPNSDLFLSVCSASTTETVFEVVIKKEKYQETMPLFGSHNMANFLVALGMVLGENPKKAQKAIESMRYFQGIPGRFELAFRPTKAEPSVFVDYAHTPDAVFHASNALASIAKPVVVLGCGGDRDRSKRSLMAKSALQEAKYAIFTSDNPRSEDPNVILREMTEELSSHELKKVTIIENRTLAIQAALQKVEKTKSPVLIAGKGHESYQEMNNVRFHLDDREEVRRTWAAFLAKQDSLTQPLLSGWSATRLANVMKGKLVQHGFVRPHQTLQSDSREVKKNDIFIALRGELFDGHKFIKRAVENGAVTLIVDRNIQTTPSINVVRVADTTQALGDLTQELLKEARKRSGGLKVVGITGSNGKTTTKEMVSQLLQAQQKETLSTIGNFNNHIGLPLTVSMLAPKDRIAVLEMGTNQPGDIATLATMAAREVAILTSIGASHLEKLINLDGVRDEKRQIFRGTQTAIMPHKEWLLRDRKGWQLGDATLLTFGRQGATLEVKRSDPMGDAAFIGSGVLEGISRKVHLPLPGKHNAENFAAAMLASYAITNEIPENSVLVQAANALTLPDGRLRVLKIKDRIVINDAYNANPLSTKASLQILASYSSPKIAVLGDMLELGANELVLHREVGVFARDKADLVVAIGPRSRALAEGVGEKARWFASSKEAALWLSLNAPEKATILLKASRGMALETMIEIMLENFL